MPGLPDAAAIGAVAVLNDPVRRALFEAVRRAPVPPSREEAAAAVGVSRKLAAFHLDKLVGAGLLALDASGETGAPRRGRVGRRPKRYRAADPGVQVSIPPRRTNLLAELLVEAISTTGSTEEPVAAALRVSRGRGHAIGQEERPQRSRRMGAERALALLRSLLDRLGYEPTQAYAGPVQFRSCPFHPMSADAPEVVCRIHHAYVAGLVEGMDLTSVETVLSPGSGGCCVELRPRPTGPAQGTAG